MGRVVGILALVVDWRKFNVNQPYRLTNDNLGDTELILNVDSEREGKERRIREREMPNLTSWSPSLGLGVSFSNLLEYSI